jgi:hypothetical protein
MGNTLCQGAFACASESVQPVDSLYFFVANPRFDVFQHSSTGFLQTLVEIHIIPLGALRAVEFIQNCAFSYIYVRSDESALQVLRHTILEVRLKIKSYEYNMSGNKSIPYPCYCFSIQDGSNLEGSESIRSKE